MEGIPETMTLIRTRYVAPILWLLMSILALFVSISYVLYGWSIPVQVIGIAAAMVCMLAVFVGIYAINKARLIP